MQGIGKTMMSKMDIDKEPILNKKDLKQKKKKSTLKELDILSRKERNKKDKEQAGKIKQLEKEEKQRKLNKNKITMFFKRSTAANTEVEKNDDTLDVDIHGSESFTIMDVPGLRIQFK